MVVGQDDGHRHRVERRVGFDPRPRVPDPSASPQLDVGRSTGLHRELRPLQHHLTAVFGVPDGRLVQGIVLIAWSGAIAGQG
ncbi:hypothetical protein N4G69_51815 [Streptomyces mirabilis]|uniref:hypothetical protein n=1 Tax=Streptomyces mirabilis TaxID=68239 RepID=UPI0021BE172F|nr:hypothetical protein [Streptomyces mirabilis]MCT9113859.1 hypothetical protein [Streptomyces mirabilis]